MSNIVVVNGIEIPELLYHNQRVLTYEMVANVHGVPVKTVQNAYSRNAEFFTEGEDTILLQGEELQMFKSLYLNTGQANFAPSIRLFTEYGYGLLVKPMGDKISWNVQKALVQNYFRVSNNLVTVEKPILLTPQDKLSVIKDAHFFLKDTGLADGWSDMLVRESVQQIIIQMGNQTSQATNLLPQHTITAETFMIEDLRVHFPELSSKKWIEMRMSFGKIARKVIQSIDPACKPIKTQKPISGAIREVNCWPNEHKAMVIDAIREEIQKNDDVQWKGFFNDR